MNENLIPQPIKRDPKICRNEKVKVEVFQTSDEASIYAAHEIIKLINSRKIENRPTVLGLATGSTPKIIYKELVRAYRNKEVSFENVITFNLDEYYPMSPTQIQSYHLFMNENLFNHIDIKKENINIPDGAIPPEEVEQHCLDYERKIKEVGGIDIQILGIGRSGHVGFNEPGSPIDSVTRKIYLDKITRLDASSDFFGYEHVPLQAITMGVGSILSAKRIFLLAFSEGKCRIVKEAIEGECTELCAASLLQKHSNTVFLLDTSAASELTYYKNPWSLTLKDSTLYIDFKNNPYLIKKAVIWLSQQCKKPILHLQPEDYSEYHLNGLLEQCGNAESVNLFVFQSIQDKISGWPAGKIVKPVGRELKIFDHPVLKTRKSLYNSEFSNHKKICVFSPHPDDDVISMGGTVLRLCEQGNEVHTIYETSGSIAVFDTDVKKMTWFASLYAKLLGLDSSLFDSKYEEITKFFDGKNQQGGFVDTNEILEIKRIIRESEAVDASLYCGVLKENIHFLNLPFYQTGTVVKKDIGSEDIAIVKKLLQDIQPEMIFAAGDLSDPHGTHRQCTKVVISAIEELQQENVEWAKNVEIMLYRGAWQEWEIERADLIVPMSPHEVVHKRMSIFKHQSQKDVPLFPGSDSREFWKRAEDRNKNTALLLSHLGFAQYAACEVFVRYTKDLDI